MPNAISSASSILLLTASLAAQDLVGVTWGGGNIARIDSFTGVATVVGSGTGMHNSLARDGNGVLWSLRTTGTFPNFAHTMAIIDPNAGTATDVHAGAPDLRGLAGVGGSLMYGIHNTVVGSISSIDNLVLVDLSIGTFTTIGPTGMTALQGLAFHQGTLYAWDLNLGLVTVDMLTGLATDPFPTSGFNGQGLCSHPDGRLLLGAPSGLHSIDPTTGTATLIAAITGVSDLRGIEAFGGFSTPFGQGCNGAFGPVAMSVGGNLSPGGTFTSTSTNHAASSFGVLIFGLSTTSNLGLPLPLSMDPILGTVGCNLYVSIDATLSAFTGAVGPANLQFSFVLPPGTANAVFHVQHACFEAVPGGASFSNGVTVNVGP